MRCERCKGYGKEVALGNIMVDCPDCLGVGGVKEQAIGKLNVLTGEDLDTLPAPKRAVRNKRMMRKPAKTKDSQHGQLGQADKLQT